MEGGWTALADPETTTVLYMGRDAAAAVAQRLIAEGRSPSTPAVAVENAGRPHARIVCAQLADLGDTVGAAGFEGPVLLVIGDVTTRAAVPSASIAGRSVRSRAAM